MTRWYRCRSGESGTLHWFEAGDEGQVLREAAFPGGGGAAEAAVTSADLLYVREQLGLLGAQLYEAVYGKGTFGLVADPSPDEPVTAEQFEEAWRSALRDRHFARYDTGPLPEGTRVVGTVAALPWGPGLTGLFVDIGLPVSAFVDVVSLPRDPEDWPPVGTVGEFEVVTIRFTYTGPAPQIRLRPTATPPPGAPWPRHGPR